MLTAAYFPLRPPPYEVFFIPLEVALDPGQLEAVRFAYQVSKYGHASQVRESGGRYFDHPKSAAWIYIDEFGGRDYRTIIVLLLHDIPEDSHLMTPYRLQLNFGTDIALDVLAITKLPDGKESTPDYLGRVKAQGPRAIFVKLVDRLHNLRTLGGRTRAKQIEQIVETREYHLRLLIPALREHGGQWAEYADLIETKINDAIALYESIE